MSAGRVLLLVFGSLLALVALALIAAGAALLVARAVWADDDGFLVTDAERLTSPTHAITSGDFDVIGGPPGALGGPDRWGDLRVEARAADPRRAVFVGIGPTADVDRYLGGVARDEVVDLDFDPFRPAYERRPGLATPAPPGGEPFWAASASGAGARSVTWPVEEGSWSIVVMNADGGAGVDVVARVGARISFLVPLVIALLAAGVLLAVGAGLMIYFGARTPRAPPPRPGAPPPAAPA